MGAAHLARARRMVTVARTFMLPKRAGAPDILATPGGAELGGGRLDIAFLVLAGVHTATTLTLVRVPQR